MWAATYGLMGGLCQIARLPEALNMAQSKRRCGRFPLERLEVFDSAQRGWNCPIMILTLDAKRRLCIPVTFAVAKPGGHFEITVRLVQRPALVTQCVLFI